MTDTPLPLPEGLRWIKLVCRLGRLVTDSVADVDAYPDLLPVGGTLKLTTSPNRVRVREADGRWRSVEAAGRTYTIRADGELIDGEGRIGVYIPDPTSLLVEPQGYTITAGVKPNGGNEWRVTIGGDTVLPDVVDLVAMSSVGSVSPSVTASFDARLYSLEQGLGVDVEQAVEDWLTANPPAAPDASVAALLGDRDSAAHGAVLAIAEPQGEVDPRTAVIQVSGDVTMPPTPYDHSHYVHPSVVHVPGGWNGYPYWMAVTPLDGVGNSQQENPCIYASTDGDTWVEPSGIVNPITAPPGVPAYHADTELVLHNGTMYCFYTTNWVVENNVSVYRCSYKTSTDGVTWSAQQTAYSYDRTLRRFQTPTIRVRDGVWHVFAVDEVTKKIVHMQGPSAAGPWSEPIYGALSTPLPAGRDVWHITIDWTGSEWHLLLNDATTGMSGGNGSLFFYRSTDEGRNWSGGQQLLHRIGPDWGQIYRSAWVATRTGGRLSYDVWINVFHTGPGISRKLKRGRLVFGAEPLEVIHERDMQAARMGYPSVLVFDDWNRPDGPLGNAPTGQEWVPVLAGSAASVSGRLARFTGPGVYVADSGKADVYVEVDLRELAASAFGGVVVRGNGATGTYIFFGWVGAIKLTVWNGGSPAADLTNPNVVGALTRGDVPVRLGVRAKGDKIIRYVNGSQLGAPYTIPPQYTALLSGTHHGFGAPHTTASTAPAVGDVLIRSL